MIVAIGLLLAGGVGLAAGLGSMREWRLASNDASFGALAVHDLRVEAEEGAFAPAGSLARAAEGIPAAEQITAVSERLIVPTQIDATAAAGASVITPGQLIGVRSSPARSVEGVAVAGPPVDAIALEAGRGLDAEPGGAIVGTLYAEENGIDPGERIVVAGGGTLDVAGLGSSPETFVPIGPGGPFRSARDFGSLFVELETAQIIAGRRGQVNDLALTLEQGADPDLVAAQLTERLRAEVPGFGATVTTVDDLEGRRVLYDDAVNDQQLFDVFAFLILAGAAFGAFNLISRTVEAQRREIGIGMALGVEPWRLAIRPLAMALQIAVLGVALGVGVGLAVNEWLRSVLAEQLPLPFLETDFQVGTFLQRAAIGFVLPLIAAAGPVWRGLRVTPVEAIRVGFRSARGSGLAPALARVPLPGGSVSQMPLRNVARAPRRTLLTVFASAAVVAVAVAMSGMLDSFSATVDRSSAEVLRGAPDRLSVTLDRAYPAGAAEVRAVGAAPAVGRAGAKLTLPASLAGGGSDVEVIVSTLAPDPIWEPRASEGALPRGPREILISESAAEDLGAEPGDELTLTHPLQVAPGRIGAAATSVRVSGLHPDPFRFGAYMSEEAAATFGMPGKVNAVDVAPAPGSDGDDVNRSLLGLGSVASVEAASSIGTALDEGLEDFAAVIRVVIAIAIVLILLIAFNAAAINADERSREHATMFAYGLRPATVVRLAMAESAIMGVLATLAGVALGVAILGWVVNVNTEEVLPELGVVVALSPQSILLGALAGAGAMTIAPLMTIRRLRRMDVPSTLRVVE